MTINILKIIEDRFKKLKFENIEWDEIYIAINKNTKALKSLEFMENSGGEPCFWKKENGKYLFTDFSIESPKGRRSLCYDNEALEKRKKFKPIDSAVNLAEKNGLRLMTENEYKEFQKILNIDMKTSSWIETPSEIRLLGGAIFCDRRYNNVFTYHNGAESYYESRGFRVILEI